MLAILGAASIFFGADIIQTERGWTQVISGTVAASGGLIILALGAILAKLEAFHQTFTAITTLSFSPPVLSDAVTSNSTQADVPAQATNIPQPPPVSILEDRKPPNLAFRPVSIAERLATSTAQPEALQPPLLKADETAVASHPEHTPDMADIEHNYAVPSPVAEPELPASPSQPTKKEKGWNPFRRNTPVTGEETNTSDPHTPLPEMPRAIPAMTEIEQPVLPALTVDVPRPAPSEVEDSHLPPALRRKRTSQNSPMPKVSDWSVDWLEKALAGEEDPVNAPVTLPSSQPVPAQETYTAPAQTKDVTSQDLPTLEHGQAPLSEPTPEPEQPVINAVEPRQQPGVYYTPPSMPVRNEIGRYKVGSASYIMYSDGSIEAHTEAGVTHFSSMAELKAHLEKGG